EPSLITNQALTYVFEGITDDGRYYVSATFPLVAPILPADFSPEEAAKRGFDPAFRLPDRAAERKYADYFKRTARELEQLPPDKFQPDLARLNNLLSSLNIRGRD
ncbi:MAG TPA: hypothetical protein VFX96_15735, partial [Pyrinomonadaceae bacterium]|nr:hypothetical protein [Pyrinomonadaceae bacterium]